MSVTAYRGWTSNVQAGPNGRQAQDIWTVGDATSDLAAISALGISYGGPYVDRSSTSYSTILANDFKAKALGPKYWEVTVSYSESPNAATWDLTPLNKPTDWGWQFGSVTEQFDTDTGGHDLTNSAGDGFQTARTITTIISTATKNVPWSSFAAALAIQNCVATDTSAFWYGAPKGSLYCRSIQPMKPMNFVSGTPPASPTYVPLLYTFEIRIAIGFENQLYVWYSRIADKGTRGHGLNGTTAVVCDICDITGTNRISQPVPLVKGIPFDPTNFKPDIVAAPTGWNTGYTPTGALTEAGGTTTTVNGVTYMLLASGVVKQTMASGRVYYLYPPAGTFSAAGLGL